MKIDRVIHQYCGGGFYTSFQVQGKIGSSFDQADQWENTDFEKVSIVGVTSDGRGNPMDIPLVELR